MPCITPVLNNQDASMYPRQLKRKVRKMETQALNMNDRVIELEVAVKQKYVLIDKHLKQMRLLNDQNSKDKKAHNLVSSNLDFSSTNISNLMLHIMLLTGFVFRIAGI